MLNVPKLDSKGKRSGEVGLPEDLFKARISTTNVADALVRQLSNRRRALADTKDRTEIRGGGKKPWRQKGTGRARAGSSRSPLWRGGAVSMGPRGEANYKKDMPRKQRRAAIKSILSSRVREGLVCAMEPLKMDKPHTQTIIELLVGMEASAKHVLFVLAARDLHFEKSVRNIPKAKTVLFSNLNPHDLLRSEQLVLCGDVATKLQEVLS